MDYKKYSLENLEKWIEDAINSSEASPQEIYDVIKMLYPTTTTAIKIIQVVVMNF